MTSASGTNNTQTPHKELYSTKILAGSRTYFINLKEDRKGNKYIVIKESKKLPEGGFEKHQIIIYQEDFVKMTNGLNEVFQFLSQNSTASQAQPASTEATE